MRINFKHLPEIFRFDLPEGMQFHLQVSSYTAQNVAKSTLTPTATDLGYLGHGSIDLKALGAQLSAYEITPTTPEHVQYILNTVGHSADQFTLQIDLVGSPVSHHCEF